MSRDAHAARWFSRVVPSLMCDPLSEHATGANIAFLESDEIVDADGAFPLHEPECLPQSRAVEGVAQRARVGEARLPTAAADVLAHGFAGAGAEAIFGFVGQLLRDEHELVIAVVRKFDVMRDAR